MTSEATQQSSFCCCFYFVLSEEREKNETHTALCALREVEKEE